MTIKSQNIYEYKKVKTIDKEDWYEHINMGESIGGLERDRQLRNKINELVIEQNHLMKDFELYKKAFKEHVKPQ